MNRFALLLLASGLLATALGAQDKPADVPKGEVTKYRFEQSKVFPGTGRDYWIYVSKQYDPAKPACVYVGQDGEGFNTLDAACGDKVYSRKVKVVGSNAFQPPTKPPKPRL